jgi:hypothetical protein
MQIGVRGVSATIQPELTKTIEGVILVAARVCGQRKVINL